MGSIPTRPRQLLPLFIVGLVAVSLLAPTVSVQGAAPDSSASSDGSRFSTPFWVMIRSAALPGWGQFYNGKWWKGLLIGGAESALIYGVYREDDLANQAADRAKFEADPNTAAFWRDVSAGHKANKKDYLWWGAFTVLLSIGDAYVDANLKGFDLEFREEDSAVLLSFRVMH